MRGSGGIAKQRDVTHARVREGEEQRVTAGIVPDATQELHPSASLRGGKGDGGRPTRGRGRRSGIPGRLAHDDDHAISVRHRPCRRRPVQPPASPAPGQPPESGVSVGRGVRDGLGVSGLAEGSLSCDGVSVGAGVLVGDGLRVADGFFVGDAVESGSSVPAGSVDPVGSADSSSIDGDGSGEVLGSIDAGLSVGSAVGGTVAWTDGSGVSIEGDDRSPSSRPNAPAVATPVPATRPATSRTIAIAWARIAIGKAGLDGDPPGVADGREERPEGAVAQRDARGEHRGRGGLQGHGGHHAVGEVRGRADADAGGGALELASQARLRSQLVGQQAGHPVQLVGSERPRLAAGPVLRHRSFSSSARFRRANPRCRWVLTVPSGRSVASAISASDRSAKNRSATTSR